MYQALQLTGLVFGAPQWWPAAIILIAIIAAIAVWSYRVAHGNRQLQIAGWVLKILAVAALAFSLLEPMQRVERPRPGANIMAIAADNSRSMEMRPAGQAQSRMERFQPFLGSDSAWQKRLAQDFDLRRYAFADRLVATDDLSELSFEGRTSSLAASLQTLRERVASRPIAGAVIFTDGLATDDFDTFMSSEQFPFPVYPVVHGNEDRLTDVRIAEETVTLSAFELSPVTIEASVYATGTTGEDVVVRLFDTAGETLEKQRIESPEPGKAKRVRFQYRPESPGIQFVTLRAALASEDTESLELESRKEVTAVNNNSILAIPRGGGPYRVLYVAGRPNWEFKFIRRALEEDVEIDLDAIIRLAKEEPKFSFRDRGVESANPLVAGFTDDEETAARYDEPVLVAFGDEEERLKSGFPGDEEGLYYYDAIVLDDVEAAFFSQRQMLLLRSFVAERGGGIMMLGGQESFRDGGYEQTPLADVLPVYVGDASRVGAAGDAADRVSYQLTREGNLQPWLRLRDDQSAESNRNDERPPFRVWNQVASAKPGASVLAELSSQAASQPGLVGHRFGKGRALALLVGDFWRWSMRREERRTDDLAQSWRQMTRWLTNDTPRRVEVKVQPPANPLDAHRIDVQLRDPAFKPLDNAEVQIEILAPDGSLITLNARADMTRNGMYTAEYWSQADGAYLCTVKTKAPDQSVLPNVQTGWSAQPSAAEFANVAIDRKRLETLAERSGGSVVQIDSLESFAASLPLRKVPISETRLEPLWHRPWLVAFAIGCLCLEWGLRRWKGLP